MFSRLKLGLLALAAVLMLNACGGSSGGDAGSLTASNTKLSALEFNGASLSPVFQPQKVSGYTVEVAGDVEAINIVATAEDSENVSIESYRRRVYDTSTEGKENQVVVQSGVSFSQALNYGNNVIAVRVSNKKNTQHLEYLITVHRVSNRAALQGVGIDLLNSAAVRRFFPTVNGSTDDFVLTQPTLFDPAVLSYQFTVAYGFCTIGIQPFTNERHTTVTINGVDAQHATPSYVDLLEGANPIDVVVRSEDGLETKTYTFNFNRTAGTEAEKTADTRLRELEIAGTDLISSSGQSGFHCGQALYNSRVNNSQTSVDISALPAVDGAPMKIGRLVLDSNNAYAIEAPVDLNPGEAMNFTIAEGINRFGISVRPTATSTPVRYHLVVTRSITNWVEVSTGEELQNALKNAEPKQEIVINPGTYTAAATAANSGLDGAHFYSDSSGTAEEPIYLRARGQVVLAGDDLGTNTVLQLSGSHWRFFGFEIANARNGLVLDAASDNRIDSVLIRDIGERGLQVRNGSHNNALQRINIRDVGSTATAQTDAPAEAVVIGSDDSEWLSAPVPGAYASDNSGNVLSNFVLGPNVLGELLDLKEGATQTIAQFGIFDSEGSGLLAERNAQVSVRGNDSNLRFNTFYQGGSDIVNKAVSVDDASETWHSTAWGEDNRVHSNALRYTASTAVAVDASANVSRVEVASNFAAGGVPASSTGAAIATISTPLYQIQTAGDSPKCLETQIVPLNIAAEEEEENIVEVELLLVGECVSGSNQLWQIEHQGDGEVIIYAAGTQKRLMPIAADFRSRLRAVGLNDAANSGLHPDSYIFRWYVNFSAAERNEFELSNKFARSFVMSVVALDDASGNEKDALAMQPASGLPSQRFVLVEQ